MKNLKEIEFQDCEPSCEHAHKENIDINMPKDHRLSDLAGLFKILGDTTRIKIIYTLFSQEMCVCDIADALEMTHSAISHQLRVLKQARLVKSRKEGKSVIYSLDDEHISLIFNCGLSHIEEIYNS